MADNKNYLDYDGLLYFWGKLKAYFATASHSHGNITNAGKLGTASKVVITDSNGSVTTSSVSTTTLDYLDATSSIQTQLNGKAASSHGTHVTYATANPSANGTASAGSANNVSRGDHVHPLQTTVSGNAGSATKLATARTIDGVDFDGSATISHYGTCGTAAGTAAKVVALSGYKLVTGGEVLVKFTITNSAASPTLNVNSTGAKAIMYRGAAITAGYLAANRVYKFVYDGTNYELVGDINVDTNTDTKVTQTASTSNSEIPIVLKKASSSGGADSVYYDTGVTVNPSTHTVSATTFVGSLTGDVSGNVSGSAGSVVWSGVGSTPTTLAGYGITDAKIANGVITLGSNTITPLTSHPSITAGSNTTPTSTLSHGGTFTAITGVTKDTNGHVTALATTTYTLPGSGNTDTKTASTASTGAQLYLIGATAQAATGQDTKSNANCYIGTDNCLYSGGSKVLTSHQSLANYYTKSDIDTKLTSAMHYKGSVDYLQISSTGAVTGKTYLKKADGTNNITSPAIGDFYNVVEDGSNWAWTGSAWDQTGFAVEFAAIPNTDIDTIVAS